MKGKIAFKLFDTLMNLILIATVIFNTSATWVNPNTFQINYWAVYSSYFQFFLCGYVVAKVIATFTKVNLNLKLPALTIAAGFILSIIAWYFSFTYNFFNLTYNTTLLLQALLGAMTAVLAIGILRHD